LYRNADKPGATAAFLVTAKGNRKMALRFLRS
jgi:hypothetical protein